MDSSAAPRWRALLEITRSLGVSLDLKTVLPKVLDNVFRILPQATRGWILIAEKPSGRLQAYAVRQPEGWSDAPPHISRTLTGKVLGEGKAILSSDAGEDERFQSSESVLDLKMRSLLCAPLVGAPNEPLGMIHLDAQDPSRPFSADDLDVLVNIANLVGQAVAHARLHETALQFDRRERDLATASQVQMHFLPQERPTLSGYELFDYYNPADAVGGDYFGYTQLPNGQLAIGVGDVAGHGVPAALLMARLCAEARYCLVTHPVPADAVRALNRHLTRQNLNFFITFALCVIDPQRHEMTVVNAGHLPPLLLSAHNGEITPIGTEIARPPLGIDSAIRYEQATIPMCSGDVVMLYTDGVSEARTRDGTMYGSDRVQAAIARAQGAEQAVRSLLEDVQRFLGGAEQEDDMCIVALAVQGGLMNDCFALLGVALLAVSTTAEPVAGQVTETRPAASREAIVADWMRQDFQAIRLPPELEQAREAWRREHLASPEARHDDVMLEPLPGFVNPRDAVVEQRLVARVLDELQAADPALRRERDALVQSGLPGCEPRWRQLYIRACELRRGQRLQPLLAQWTRFVFSRQPHIPASWKYTEVLSDAHTDRHRNYRPGSALQLLEMDGLWGRVRTLIEDPAGMIRDPDVAYDGRHLLFAWKKSDRQDDFHLYEMDLETSSIRQLTAGLGFADYEGAYLPDGNIVFSSTRCCQTVDCNWVDVSNLYGMDGDGRFLRRLGFDQVHTIFPTVTDDGRVLFTRWEYNDRGQIYPQPLFQMRSDGTNQQEFYGGNSWFPTNIIHARKVPGSRQVLAVVTGHHRPAHGKLALIDPGQGRQEGAGVQLIAPRRPTDYVRVDQYALAGTQFQYPYPLDEQHCLVTLALPTPQGKLGRFDGYFLDAAGHRELLIEGQSAGEDGVGCKQILPLAARPRPPARPSTVDFRRTAGTVYLQDIYQGPGLAGIPRGTVAGCGWWRSSIGPRPSGG